MPRDTAWIEEIAVPTWAPPASTEAMRQMDFSAAGLDLPCLEPAPRPAHIVFAESSRLYVLLGLALDDFTKVLLDLRYKIDTGNEFYLPAGWRSGRDDHKASRCTVCVAGSVVAKTYKAKRNSLPGDFDDAIEDRLAAIDDLRLGNIGDALRSIGRHEDADCMEVRALSQRWQEILKPVCDASNRISGSLLLAALRQMQAELRATGL